MSDIAPVGRPSLPGTLPATRPAASLAASESPTRGSDSVEVSRTAQLLSRIADLPPIRQDLVDRVKTQIAEGTYDTPDKVDALLDSLMEDLV